MRTALWSPHRFYRLTFFQCEGVGPWFNLFCTQKVPYVHKKTILYTTKNMLYTKKNFFWNKDVFYTHKTKFCSQKISPLYTKIFLFQIITLKNFIFLYAKSWFLCTKSSILSNEPFLCTQGKFCVQKKEPSVNFQRV